ncbi:MAG TPA: hypothetical protein VFP85_16580, partial [Vicinamibacterales bacterium]|nr:hypothetical protein [Vicinamibacterales bacterium]
MSHRHGARVMRDVAAAVAHLVRAVALAWLACAGGLGAANAAESPPGEVAKLPQPLTREASRDLVSRLSDAEVRKLLIEQLDRNSPPPAARTDGGMGMMGKMGDHAVMWRTRVSELAAAGLALPATTASVFERLLAGTRPSLVLFVLAAMVAVGALAELAWRRATRQWRARHSQVRGEGFFEDALRRSTGLLVDFLGLLMFGAGALGTFFALWQGHADRRNFALGLLAALLL